MRSWVVLVWSRTSQRVTLCKNVINMLHHVCMPTECWTAHLYWHAMGQWQVYYMRNDIVWISSWTSRNLKALQDISNMLHTVCMPAEKLHGLHLCTDGIGQWKSHKVHPLLWPIAFVQSCSLSSCYVGIHPMCSILHTSCKALGLWLVQEHMHTI